MKNLIKTLLKEEFEKTYSEKRNFFKGRTYKVPPLKIYMPNSDSELHLKDCEYTIKTFRRNRTQEGHIVFVLKNLKGSVKYVYPPMPELYGNMTFLESLKLVPIQQMFLSKFESLCKYLGLDFDKNHIIVNIEKNNEISKLKSQGKKIITFFSDNIRYYR